MKRTLLKTAAGGLLLASIVLATSASATLIGDFTVGPGHSWVVSWTDTTGGAPMDKWDAFITGGGATFDAPVFIDLPGWTGTVVNPTHTYGAGPANASDRTISLSFAGTPPSGGVTVDMLVWCDGRLVPGQSWQWTDLPGQGGGWQYVNNPVPEPTTMIAGALLLLPFGASTLRSLRRRTA